MAILARQKLHTELFRDVPGMDEKIAEALGAIEYERGETVIMVFPVHSKPFGYGRGRTDYGVYILSHARNGTRRLQGMRVSEGHTHFLTALSMAKAAVLATTGREPRVFPNQRLLETIEAARS